jgi:hypothetical protein
MAFFKDDPRQGSHHTLADVRGGVNPYGQTLETHWVPCLACTAWTKPLSPK